MEHSVLTMGVSEELYLQLKAELGAVDATVVRASNLSAGIKLFAEQTFSLVVTDLQEMRKYDRVELLTGLRRTRFVPIFAVEDFNDPELVGRMLDIGVDACQPRGLAPSLLAKQAKAVFRRHTAYNYYDRLVPRRPRSLRAEADLSSRLH